MKLKKSKVKKRAAALLCCLLTVFTSLIGCLSVSAADNVKVNLTLGKSLTYESYIDWSTHMMYADGNMAYCVNPALKAPSGTFSINNNNLTEITSSDSRYAMLSKALYYCYGGGGFSTKVNSFVTKTNHGQPANETYSGRTMSAFMGNLKKQYQLSPNGSDLHYLLTHRVLAKTYGDDNWGYALTSYWRWAVEDIETALKSAPAAPKSFIYILDPKNGSQKVILQKSVVKLQLQKVSANTDITDGNSCYSLKGAKYNIYLDKACTEYFSYITTDENGYGKYGAGTNGADVPLQTYYVKEVTAPKGYALDTTVYEMKNTGKTADGVPVYRPYNTSTKKYELKDTPKNDPVEILLRKTDKNGKGLANAEFTIKYYACTKDELASSTKATKTWIFRTDEDGYTYYTSDEAYFVSGDDLYYPEKNSVDPIIPIGTVTVQETKSPDGYIIDSTVHIIEVTDNNSGNSTIKTYNYPTIPNEPNPGKISIVKTSDDGVVSGIEFKVKNNDTGEEETLTTGSDGTIAKEYYAGSYTITEICDETKYLPQSPQTVTVKAGATATVKFHNKLATNDLTIRKTSSDGKVSGITFHIKDNSTGKIIDKVTDSKGYITVEGLTIDNSYTVTEEVPEGYTEQEPQTITLKANTINILNFQNVRETGNLLIKKESTDGVLSGHSFTVRPADSYDYLTPQQGVETDVNGEIKFTDIPTGDYIVTEVGPWELYYTNPEPQRTVTVTANEPGKYTAVNFKNTAITYPAKIVKTSPDGNVSGIRFEVTGYFNLMKGIRETRTYTTDKNGEINLDLANSYFGEEFTVKEIVPDGYEEQPEKTITLPFNDEGTGEPVVVEFNNVPKPDIKIVKTSDDGVVEGFTFELSYLDSDGLTATETAVTDKDGVILFKAVDSGIEYTITEQPQQGYEEQPSQKVTPKPGETATVKFHNTPSTKIGTTAVDKSTNDHYGYVNQNTTIVDTVAYSNAVVGRTYTLKGKMYLQDGSETSVTAEKTFVAEDTNGTVDVEFNFDSTAFADKSVVIFEELYYNGIKIAEHTDINDDKQTVTIYGLGNIRFIKTDENGNPLAGITFNIYSDKNCTTAASDCSGKAFALITTDKSGIVEFNDLLYGTYYIAETQTENGRQLLTDVITADVTKDGTILTFNGKELELKEVVGTDGSNEQVPVVENVDIPELPFTGGEGIYSSIIVGLALIGAAAALLLKKNKHRKRGEVKQ